MTTSTGGFESTAMMLQPRIKQNIQETPKFKASLVKVNMTKIPVDKISKYI